MMTRTLESTPPSAVSAVRKLAYRRLAAAILGLDIQSLTEDLQLNRTRRAMRPGMDLEPVRVAAMPASTDRQVALR